MPRPNDLVGQRYGKLLVTSAAPAVGDGGSRVRWWNVVCDCGATEALPDYRIPNTASNRRRRDVAYACRTCRQTRICLACQRPFVADSTETVCSEDCRQELRRKRDLTYYYNRKASDPELDKRRAAAVKAKIAADPAYAAAWREREEKRAAKKRADLATNPAYRDALNARAREQHVAKAEQRNARRRELRRLKLDAMTPEQREEWLAKWREYTRAWKAAERATPEGAAKNRERVREWNRQKRLRDLLMLGGTLTDLRDEPGDDTP